MRKHKASVGRRECALSAVSLGASMLANVTAAQASTVTAEMGRGLNKGEAVLQKVPSREDTECFCFHSMVIYNFMEVEKHNTTMGLLEGKSEAP